MFEIRGNAEFGNIGSRNTFMVKKILQEENMRISAEDTGGAFARTMILDIESGDVAIRTMGKPVSYTHLDVYKRQTMFRSSALPT